MRIPVKYLFILLAVHFSILVNGQVGLCPVNMDFEAGSFLNWQCRTGKALATGGLNNINWTGTTEFNGRHSIIKASDAKKDFYGNFPEAAPGSNGYSIKLGNANVFSEAESISYTYVIPANVATFSISYSYAVVLQNPDHQFYDQPRFRANVINVTDNTLIDCVSFDFTSSSSLPGFKVSAVDPTVLYKDWTPVTLDLAVYAGKTIQLEFITSDCTLEAHFGYAYIDVSSNCSGTFNGSIVCEGDNQTTLTPPFGYKSYQWFSDNSFSQVISTAQILTVSPLPPSGSIYPVIVTPYPGFGCTDTLYAQIAIAPKPLSIAGTDRSVCRYQDVQIGGPNNPNYSYSWIKGNDISNKIISNPFIKNTSFASNELIVKTTDILTQCFSYDTIIVATIPVDTSIRLNGKNNYCSLEPLTAELTVGNAVSSVQWYNDRILINNVNVKLYKPSATGIYWARVNQNGCFDTTGKIPIDIYQGCNYVPSAFTPNGDGLNDKVTPFIVGLWTLKNFSVYNRWGNPVFSTNKNGEGWDGTFKGKLLDGGVFVWILQITTTDGKVETRKGTVTIIR